MISILASLLSVGLAVPSAYVNRLRHTQPAVHAAYEASVKRAQGLDDPSGACEEYRSLNTTQGMWFAGSHCSIASMDMTIVLDGVLKSFRMGDLVPITCDNMFCPPPHRVDCYKDPRAICSHFPGTECWINQFERTGPWGRSEMKLETDILPGATVST